MIVKKGVCIIATNRYKMFIQQLIDGIDEYFLPFHYKIIFLFVDEYMPELKSRHEIVQTIIPSYKFPQATLYRFRIFYENRELFKECSHLFYLDSDMAIVDVVGNEFLTEGLVIVRHPGYYKNNGWGDGKNPVNSTSYLPKELRKHYYCGGVQGGETIAYLKAVEIMHRGIEEDERNGIMPEWHDETMWVKYIHTSGEKFTEFTPEYCMPEPIYKRLLWGINDIKPKILALEKEEGFRK